MHAFTYFIVAKLSRILFLFVGGRGRLLSTERKAPLAMKSVLCETITCLGRVVYQLQNSETKTSAVETGLAGALTRATLIAGELARYYLLWLSGGHVASFWLI